MIVATSHACWNPLSNIAKKCWPHCAQIWAQEFVGSHQLGAIWDLLCQTCPLTALCVPSERQEEFCQVVCTKESTIFDHVVQKLISTWCCTTTTLAASSLLVTKTIAQSNDMSFAMLHALC